MLRRTFAALAVAAMALILLAGCGGGGEEGQIGPTVPSEVSPTAVPSPAATATVKAALSSGSKAVGRDMARALRILGGGTAAVETPAGTPTASEEYRAEMLRLLPDVEQIFSVDWPAALGTEPLGGEAWQEEVSRLAASIDSLRVRAEMVEAPEDWAVSHALLINSLSKMAEAVREVRIAGATRDADLMKEAMADTEIAFALLAEATGPTVTEEGGYFEEHAAFETMEEACSAIEQATREGGGSGGGSWGRIDPSMSPFCVRWGIAKNLRPRLAADGTYDRSEIDKKMAQLAQDIEEFIGD